MPNSKKTVRIKLADGSYCQSGPNCRKHRSLYSQMGASHSVHIVSSVKERQQRLESEWHPVLNGNLQFQSLSKGSHAKVWWKCPVAKDHVWLSVFKSRNQEGIERNCPFCGGRKPSSTNNLAISNPDIASEFDIDKNSVPAEKISPNSTSKVWWKCKNGHSWQATPNSRRKGFGCRFCSYEEAKIEKDYSKTLEFLNPDLLVEFDDEINELKPSQIAAGGKVMVAWKCAVKSHTWVARVGSRTGKRAHGCPYCSKGFSKIEQDFKKAFTTVLDYIEPDSQKRVDIPWKNHKNMQVDITGVYNGNKIAIEYDGIFYHSAKQKQENDLEKTKALLKAGYIVVRIRENELKHVPIMSPNLLQLNHVYLENGRSKENVPVTLEKVKFWLENRVKDDLVIR